MMIGSRIANKKDMSLKNKIINFLNPDNIFIPLVIGTETNISIFVKKGDYVYKGSILGKSQGFSSLPILASVSGVVLGIEEKYYLNGKKVKCIVIKNDFKELSLEKQPMTENISQIKKDNFVEILKNN